MIKDVWTRKSEHLFLFRSQGRMRESVMKLLDIYEKSDMFRSAKGGEVPIETASLFVCGIVLREIFFPEIEFSSPEEYSFEQMWYMICLHHDKRMERHRIWKRACLERREKSARRWEGRNIDTNCNWRPMQLCFSPLFHYLGEGMRFTNGACVRDCLLSEAEVKDYFYFRNTCSRKGGMDHGIAGGLLLYENLIRRNLQCKGELDKKALNLYSYAANTMMVHNLCEEEKEERRTTLDTDPLLLLFVLAEAIEPLQYAQKIVDYRTLLGAVEVEIFEKEFMMRMDPRFFAVDEMEKRIEKMLKKIKVGCEFMRETSRICITM